MAKGKERMNLTTEIMWEMRKKFIICRVTLIISLVGNIIQVAIWFFRKWR